MKFCPKCEVKLKKEGADLQCPKCGYVEGEVLTQQKKVIQKESIEALNVFAENEGEQTLPVTRFKCPKIQAMELLCSAGLRARVASSNPLVAASTISQFLSNEYITESAAPISHLV